MDEKPKKIRGGPKGKVISAETRAKLSAAAKRRNHLGVKQPKHSAFMKGNRNGAALCTPEDRLFAFKEYCSWIARGHSGRAFSLQHPTLRISGKRMEAYVKEFAHEFPMEELDIAHCESLARWEALGEDMMIGKIKRCQPAIFQMFMRNKFQWDREQQLIHSVEPEARELLRRWKEMDD